MGEDGRGWERMGSGRTEGFNGFGDGVEGGLLGGRGGAIWLLLGGCHCCSGPDSDCKDQCHQASRSNVIIKLSLYIAYSSRGWRYC